MHAYNMLKHVLWPLMSNLRFFVEREHIICLTIEENKNGESGEGMIWC